MIIGELFQLGRVDVDLTNIQVKKKAKEQESTILEECEALGV